MSGPVYEYPAIPAWSRGWDDNIGPTWEMPTDAFPVIVPEPEVNDGDVLADALAIWLLSVIVAVVFMVLVF